MEGRGNFGIVFSETKYVALFGFTEQQKIKTEIFEAIHYCFVNKKNNIVERKKKYVHQFVNIRYNKTRNISTKYNTI